MLLWRKANFCHDEMVSLPYLGLGGGTYRGGVSVSLANVATDVILFDRDL